MSYATRLGGYVDPDQGPDNELSLPAVPPEAFEHRGKWVAFRGRRILTGEVTLTQTPPPEMQPALPDLPALASELSNIVEANVASTTAKVLR